MPEPPEKSEQGAANDNVHGQYDGYGRNRRRSDSRANKQKSKAMPKEEPPSTFEESLPPYSYQAQDSGPSCVFYAPLIRYQRAGNSWSA